MTFALVVPSGIPYFSGVLVENIERELRPLGYETIVGHSTGDPSNEIKLVKTILGMSSKIRGSVLVHRPR